MDSDGDGISECADLCPYEAGSISNSSCPELDCSLWEIGALSLGLIAALVAIAGLVASGSGLLGIATMVGLSTAELATLLGTFAATSTLTSIASGIIAYVCNH